MEWIIILALIIVPLLFKMNSNYKQNTATNGLIKALEKHTPEELAEIVEWEKNLRIEMAKLKILSDREALTHAEFFEESKRLIDKHREIEKKYNITEEEMVEYYLSARNVHS